MAVEERRIHVNSLTPGMYVCRLDRPWAGTPFPLEGLLVESIEDIDAIRRWSTHVHIDVEKSLDPSPRNVLLRLGYGRVRGASTPPPVRWEAQQAPLDEELPRAKAAWADARAVTVRVTEDLRLGRRVSAAEIEDATSPLVESVIRNPNAYFWLETVRERDPYAYGHALNSAALAATFGRHLGLSRETLVDLASGGLLMDIGFSLIDSSVIAHRGALDDAQRAGMQKHVEVGLERLRRDGAANAAVLEMIGAHHERHDGSGYPSGTSGFGIPLMARILGLVDSYDAMCTTRPFRAALSQHHALQSLYRERERLFQGELVEQFSQALGVYPTGSLVELSTGQIAVVKVQNPARRLYPRVTVVLRAGGAVDPSFPDIDLWTAEGPDGQRVSIVRALPRESCPVNLARYFV
jgi:HD-GYP domain-containing protein (c-di-GMP phosphodiesterase class II)